jgi:hypothetical protein
MKIFASAATTKRRSGISVLGANDAFSGMEKISADAEFAHRRKPRGRDRTIPTGMSE